MAIFKWNETPYEYFKEVLMVLQKKRVMLKIEF
jgi:hypothetical protein